MLFLPGSATAACDGSKVVCSVCRDGFVLKVSLLEAYMHKHMC